MQSFRFSVPVTLAALDLTFRVCCLRRAVLTNGSALYAHNSVDVRVHDCLFRDGVAQGSCRFAFAPLLVCEGVRHALLTV